MRLSNILPLSNDLNVITAEINSYKNMAGQAVFEIGKRLKHVKEKDLVHGEFGNWLEIIDINKFQASRFIKVYEELGNSNLLSSANIGFKNLLEVATMPEKEREKTHTIPSTGEQKTVDEMTVRELREVKKALKEAESKAEQAKKSEEIALKRLEQAENKPPKIVEKVVVDETKVQRLQQELHKLDKEKKELESKMNNEKKDAESYRQLKSDLENLRNRRDDMIRQIDNAGTIGKFVAKVEKALEEDLAPIKYIRAIEEIHDSKPVLEALDGIVTKVEKWCKEIRSVMPKEKYIDVEVIEYE